MRRITRLVVLGPELRPLGAALLGVWACAGRAALGAGGVVGLVGFVGSGPVGRGHGSRNEKAPACGAVLLLVDRLMSFFPDAHGLLLWLTADDRTLLSIVLIPHPC